MIRQERGFTIVEVLMFLAISALLLTAAIISVSSSVSYGRFTDAVRSTASYLQGQYSVASSGQNDRPATYGCNTSGPSLVNPQSIGMTDCVVLGRYILIKGSTISARYIVGNIPTFANISPDDSQAILNANPQIATADVYENTFNVPWSIQIAKSKIAGSEHDAIGLALIRSPASGNVLYYTFPVSDALPRPPLDGNTIKTGNLNQSVKLCVFDDSPARAGYVKLEPGQGQEIIQTDLESITGSCL